MFASLFTLPTPLSDTPTASKAEIAALSADFSGIMSKGGGRGDRQADRQLDRHKYDMQLDMQISRQIYICIYICMCVCVVCAYMVYIVEGAAATD